MRGLRIAVGLLLVAGAGLFVFEPARRGKILFEAVADSWPYALGVLAILAAVAAAVEPRKLVGPFLLGAIAAAGLAIRYERLAAALLAWWPAAVMAVGAAMAIARPAAGVAQRVAAVAWTVRRAAHGELPATLAVVCVIGGAHVDLRDAVLAHDVTVTATTVFGYVKFDVPAQWPVVLDGPPSALVALDERGRRDGFDGAAGAVLRLRSGGVGGTVVVDRW